MAASFQVDVAPDVLVWARRTAGYRHDDVAKALRLDPDRVHAWEAGEEQPTFVQLRKLAKLYHRPLAALLLPEPPAGAPTVHDFRAPAEQGEMSPPLRLALRAARERRGVAVALLEGSPPAARAFDVQAAIDHDPEHVGERIRAALGVTLEDQQALDRPESGLVLWRSAAEARGVLVFGLSGVDVHEARGFSISDLPLPVVALNTRDAAQARTFTLLHELAHIALRTGEALCDLTEHTPADARVEVFCNHVAGAALVPRDALLSEPRVRAAGPQTAWAEREVNILGRRYAVSREVILRRLLILGRTSRAHYASWRELFQTEQRAYRDRLAQSEGGPAYITKKVSQLGRLYPRIVFDAHNREAITTSAASDYLGVKVKHFDALAAEVTVGAA
jgi:Zn-dependent peptidase ImmA (M78 family)